jgi:hypothetical protein
VTFFLVAHHLMNLFCETLERLKKSILLCRSVIKKRNETEAVRVIPSPRPARVKW